MWSGAGITVCIVLLASVMLGFGLGPEVYAIDEPNQESSLGWLRSILRRLMDPILPLILHERTRYAGGFREEAFRALTPGMGEKEVRQALGDPLSLRRLTDGRTVMYYSEQVAPTDNYLIRNVVLDAKGRLIERHAEFYVD